MWLAGREDLCGDWSQAGGILRVGVGGPWFAALPDEAWPTEQSARADILKVWGDADAEVGLRLYARTCCFVQGS